MSKIVKPNLSNIKIKLPDIKYNQKDNIVKAMTEALDKMDIKNDYKYDEFVAKLDKLKENYDNFRNITIFDYDEFVNGLDDLKEYIEQGKSDSIFNRNSDENNNTGATLWDKKTNRELSSDWQTPFPAREDNQRQIYTYLSDMGLNKAAIAGIMGNIQQESGFNPSSRGMDSNGYYSTGLFQWNERWTKAWVYGTTVQSQMDYMQSNIKDSTLEKLKNVPDDEEGAKQAALIFAREFEVCDSGSYGLRKNNAKNFYQSF